MKIVDKGWAVWCWGIPSTGLHHTRNSAINTAEGMYDMLWEELKNAGCQVLRTTATATVPNKKARRK